MTATVSAPPLFPQAFSFAAAASAPTAFPLVRPSMQRAAGSSPGDGAAPPSPGGRSRHQPLAAAARETPAVAAVKRAPADEDTQSSARDTAEAGAVLPSGLGTAAPATNRSSARHAPLKRAAGEPPGHLDPDAAGATPGSTPPGDAAPPSKRSRPAAPSDSSGSCPQDGTDDPEHANGGDDEDDDDMAQLERLRQQRAAAVPGLRPRTAGARLRVFESVRRFVFHWKRFAAVPAVACVAARRLLRPPACICSRCLVPWCTACGHES